MMMTPVRVNVTHCALTLLMAIAMLGPWTPELAAQEPLDSVIPLDSIVVTVLRATDGLARAPYAVTVQSGRALQLGNTGFSLDEALQGIPGLQIQNRYNYTVGERISIRGFGARTPFGVRGITTLVDGIPATMADGQTFLDHLDIGSLGRVEVLRGPSAAMYGNGGGGVLSFQTKAPPLVPIREEATAIFGGNGLMRLQSTTSGTTGGASYLFNIAHLTYDGFRTVADPTDFTEERSDSSLFGLATRLNINGQVGLEAGGGRLLFTGTFMDLDGENAGQINRTKMYADSSQDARGLNIAQNASKDVYQGQLGATWTGPVANLNAQFVGWGLFRRMDNPIPPSIIDLSRNAFGARAMVSNDTGDDSGPVTWAAGFDLNFQRDDRLEYDNNGGVKGALERDEFQTVTATGLFAQASVGLGDRTTLEGGLRYDRFKFKVEDRFPNGDGSGQRVMDQLSPTVGLVVRATPDLSVFGNFATSLSTPTTVQLNNSQSGTGGINSDLEPQTGKTGEIGLRGQAGGIFSYEMSGFLSKLENELIQFQDRNDRDFYDNAGESTYQGIEMSVRAALPEGIFGQLSYTFMDAKFDEYDVGGNDFAGNFVPGVARNRIEGLVRYSRGFGYAEVRGDHVGKTYTNDANDPNTAVKSYTLWDLRAGLSGRPLGNGRTEVAPFVSLTNVFDAVYSSGYQPNAFGPPGGKRYYEPGPRRAFSVGLTVTFQ